MARLTGALTQHPARASFLWYASVIVLGWLLLAAPFSHASSSSPISRLDAAFTATSAVCVTGLAVRSTGHDFSPTGQAVILALIQIGGIGIMTLTTLVTFWLGGRQSMHSRVVLAESLGAEQEPDLRWVLKRVLLFTLAFEGAGFALLSIRFLFDHSLGAALWHALFHSVSAFCNAGFSLNDDSLTRYQGDYLVNVVVMVLIVCGGIGFPVMMDIARVRRGSWRDRWDQLTLHSKLILLGSSLLVVGGAGAVLLLEWDGALVGMSPPRKALAATFHSVSCRTAGFNTLEMGGLTNATLFITILLMTVGGGPCSTAGGFKVSTLAVLVLRGWSTLRGRRKIFFSRRTIPERVVDRAITTAMIFAIVAVVALTALLVFEQSALPHASSRQRFLDALFEVVSALGTVGLSTGMTTHLSAPARWVMIGLMFMGRLGPISVFAALSRGERRLPIEYAEEEPLIG